MFDTHAHLTDPPLYSDLAGVIARAAAAGISLMAVPSTDQATSQQALDLARRFPDMVLAAAGLHPGKVVAGSATALSWLADFLAGGGFSAVGETGLDARIPSADLDAQEQVFRLHAGLAREAGLPLIVHVRGAYDRVFRVLESMGRGGPGGVLHAFGGSTEMAARLFRLGFLRGVGGGVTRPQAVKLRDAIRRTPLDAMVLETDSPYIATAQTPAGQVEPRDIVQVRDTIAQLQGVPTSEVEARTTAAARALFRLETP